MSDKPEPTSKPAAANPFKPGGPMGVPGNSNVHDMSFPSLRIPAPDRDDGVTVVPVVEEGGDDEGEDPGLDEKGKKKRVVRISSGFGGMKGDKVKEPKEVDKYKRTVSKSHKDLAHVLDDDFLKELSAGEEEDDIDEDHPPGL